jgi:ABC-type transport system substrate-binding protein
MANIFVHALEGKPEKPDFSGATERDIRVSWLVTDGTPGAPVGSGPWKPASISADKIVLVPSGSKAFATPVIEEVHLPFIPDGNALANRLVLPHGEPGYVDFAPVLTEPDTFRRLRQNPDIQVLSIPSFNVFYLGFRCDRMHFDERNAVIQVIDVDKYVPLGQGAADAAKGPVPPYMHGHDPNLHQKPFNPPHARASLGSPESKMQRTSVTLVYTSVSTYARGLAGAVAWDITSYLGWKVINEGVGTWGEVLDRVKIGQPDMFIYSWNQREAHADDPYDFLIPLFHSSQIGITNLSRYSDPTVDGYLKGAGRDHHKAQVKIIDDVPMVFLSHWKRQAAYNRRVNGLRLNSGSLPEDRLVGVTITR